MIIIVLILILLLAAFLCSRSGGNCRLKSNKDLTTRHEPRDNNFLL